MIRLTAPWLFSPPLQKLFDIFEAEGATLRLVGGAVRDGLLGLPVEDIDLAVDRPPLWGMNLLARHHMTAVPTGIAHGTFTAFLNKKPYQITTLRVDVETFGRKAHVVFTKDWIQDAERRDFTLNALYANKIGEIFDPVGGLRDLEQRRVRFIGKASERVQEDFLRILRFFRFSARFGREPYDPEGLEACANYGAFLSSLAQERITDEILKILALPSPLYPLQEMKRAHLLPELFSSFSYKLMESLVALEQKTCRPPAPLLRLAALAQNFPVLTKQLRLSKTHYKVLSFLETVQDSVTEASFKSFAYRREKFLVFDLAHLQTAHKVATSALSLQEGVDFLKNLIQHFSSWEIPVFPLRGEDVLSHNVPKGKAVGSFLKQVETWWISQDLVPDRKACIDYLSTLLRNKTQEFEDPS